jgi:hypothetical protein
MVSLNASLSCNQGAQKRECKLSVNAREMETKEGWICTSFFPPPSFFKKKNYANKCSNSALIKLSSQTGESSSLVACQRVPSKRLCTRAFLDNLRQRKPRRQYGRLCRVCLFGSRGPLRRVQCTSSCLDGTQKRQQDPRKCIGERYRRVRAPTENEAPTHRSQTIYFPTDCLRSAWASWCEDVR